MKLTRYTDAAQFYQDAIAYWTRDEAVHNLMIGLTNRLIDDPLFYGSPPYFALVHDENGRVIGATLRTPPHPLHLSHVEDPAVIELIARDVYDLFPDLHWVAGAEQTILEFVRQWEAISGQGFQRMQSQRIYQLTEVIPVEGVAGEMRMATTADLPLIIEWFLAFHHEALPHEDYSPEQATHSANSYITEQRLFLWEVEGRVVTMAGYSGPTPNGIRVNAVYTPPEQRRRGYASALTAALSQYLLDSGRKFCFLYTDLDNPTSNHIYQTIGYKPVVDTVAYGNE